MIVDVHTRIWDSADALGSAGDALRRRRTQPWERVDASTAAHEQAMETVQAAFVHGYESTHLGANIPVEKVVTYVKAAPTRFFGFAGIDPTAGRPVRRLDEALNAGCVGLNLSPTGQGFHPSDSRAMALYEACAARQAPVFFDNSLSVARDAKLEFAQPYLIDEVARTFPDLRIVLTGLGFPFLDQAMALLAKHPAVFADLSELIQHPWRVYNALLLAYQHGVMDQVLFGSNFPFCTPEKAIVTIYSINTFPQGTHLPSVPREQLRSVVERDAFAALGLKAPPIVVPRPESNAPAKISRTAVAEERVR